MLSRLRMRRVADTESGCFGGCWPFCAKGMSKPAVAPAAISKQEDSLTVPSSKGEPQADRAEKDLLRPHGETSLETARDVGDSSTEERQFPRPLEGRGISNQTLKQGLFPIYTDSSNLFENYKWYLSLLEAIWATGAYFGGACFIPLGDLGREGRPRSA